MQRAFGVVTNCVVDLRGDTNELPGVTSGALDITCMKDGIPAFMGEMGQGGKNYTVDTLCMLQKAYPGARLHLCLGSDMLLSFRAWRRWRDILRISALVVHSRENGDEPALAAAAQALAAEGADILFAPGTVLEISSTQVRALAARGGDISPLVPAEVQRIILREGLYRGGTDTTYKEARCH